MQVGAIGAMPYTPYIYNTNTVTRASLNKISGINEDVLASKTDFSNLTSGETTNPLKRGESLDFAGILSMQLQMGRMNAARVMKEPEKTADEMATQAAGIIESGVSSIAEDSKASEAVASTAGATEAIPSVEATETAPVEASGSAQNTPTAFDYAKAMSAYQPIDFYA